MGRDWTNRPGHRWFIYSLLTLVSPDLYTPSHRLHWTTPPPPRPPSSGGPPRSGSAWSRCCCPWPWPGRPGCWGSRRRTGARSPGEEGCWVWPEDCENWEVCQWRCEGLVLVFTSRCCELCTERWMGRGDVVVCDVLTANCDHQKDWNCHQIGDCFSLKWFLCTIQGQELLKSDCNINLCIENIFISTDVQMKISSKMVKHF